MHMYRYLNERKSDRVNQIVLHTAGLVLWEAYGLEGIGGIGGIGGMCYQEKGPCLT